MRFEQWTSCTPSKWGLKTSWTKPQNKLCPYLPAKITFWLCLLLLLTVQVRGNMNFSQNPSPSWKNLAKWQATVRKLHCCSNSANLLLRSEHLSWQRETCIPLGLSPILNLMGSRNLIYSSRDTLVIITLLKSALKTRSLVLSKNCVIILYKGCYLKCSVNLNDKFARYGIGEIKRLWIEVISVGFGRLPFFQ